MKLKYCEKQKMDSTQNKSGLQERIFQKLFISDSLKYYRDLKNVVDTAYEKGKKEIAQKMKMKGFDIDTIIEFTGLTAEEIENL